MIGAKDIAGAVDEIEMGHGARGLAEQREGKQSLLSPVLPRCGQWATLGIHHSFPVMGGMMSVRRQHRSARGAGIAGNGRRDILDQSLAQSEILGRVADHHRDGEAAAVGSGQQADIVEARIAAAQILAGAGLVRDLPARGHGGA